MEKIASFCVDHLKLFPWIYVSRRDEVGNTIVTTFDLRMTRPNFEPVINTAEIHAIEHLWATFLRNHKTFWNKIVYFGPMWCRTWFYLLLNWDFDSKDIVDLVKETFEFVKDFEWQIPGQDPKDCWNYLDMNLPMARFVANKYLEVLNNINDKNLVYPN
jgi:S-ribosylhomocysteine lyase